MNGEIPKSAFGRAVFNQKAGSEQDKHGFYPSTCTILEYRYPLKILIPRNAASTACQWVYPVTYGGGLVEGDRVQLEVGARAGTCVCVTTQGSTKVYHCPSGELVTRQDVKLDIESGAFLCYIPQPTTCFARSCFEQTQKIEMVANSCLIFVDWFTAGRVARGEMWDFKRMYSSTHINIDGVPAVHEAVHIESTAEMKIQEKMGIFQIIATVFVIGDTLKEVIDNVLRQYGRRLSFGEQLDPRCIVGASPLEVNPCGCMIKICTTSMHKATDVISDILQPIIPILGGDPLR